MDVHFCSFVWTRCQSHQVAARSAQGSSTCQWERNESAQCSPVLSGPHPEQFVNFRAGQVFRPCSTLTFGLNKTTRSVLALLCWRRIHVDHEGPLVTSRSNVRCPMSDHTCAPAQFSHSDSFQLIPARKKQRIVPHANRNIDRNDVTATRMEMNNKKERTKKKKKKTDKSCVMWRSESGLGLRG